MRRFWWVPMAMTIALGVIGAASERAAADDVELGDCAAVEIDADEGHVEAGGDTHATAAEVSCTNRP